MLLGEGGSLQNLCLFQTAIFIVGKTRVANVIGRGGVKRNPAKFNWWKSSEQEFTNQMNTLNNISYHHGLQAVSPPPPIGSLLPKCYNLPASFAQTFFC